MKSATTTLAGLFLCATLFAQPVPVKNSFQSDLVKVISDYPAHFKNLAGESVVDNPQVSEYACRLAVKDALECKVSRYSSATKEIYSWECVMLRTDEFDEAAKKFRSLYNAIQLLSVPVNGTTAVLKGKYMQPAASVKFTSVMFDAAEKNPSLNNLKVELLLEAEMLDWVIKVLVYEKEREDTDPGRRVDR